MRPSHLLLLALITPIAPIANAEPQPTYDRVSLSVSRTADMENDTLVAVLYAEQEDEKAAVASREVNRRIAEGVRKAKADSAIKVQTLGYSTQPIYAKIPSYSGGGHRITGWRVRQSIRLESRDGEKLSSLLGSLQGQLAVSSIGYSASEEAARQHEEELTGATIQALRERAQLVANSMGSQGYRLVQMNISSDGNRPQPYPMRAMAMEMKSADAAPVLEAGTRKLTVSINATIELK